MSGFYLVLILAVGLERLAELRVSRRNQRWSLDRGGAEFGAGHYPVMVVLHLGLLVGCLVEASTLHRRFVPILGWPMLAVVLASQALRWWCIRTLGPQWNTRVIVVPGMAAVRGGPYRWLPHPNYVAVVAEGIALPLVGSAWITAISFSVLNAFLLRHRIRVENTALAELSDEAGAGQLDRPARRR